MTRFKRRNTAENRKRICATRKISWLSRKFGHLINQNPMVTREEIQEDSRSSGCNVTKRTMNNEMLRNGLKSRRPKKTPPLLKRLRYARLKFVRKRKIRPGKEYYGVTWSTTERREIRNFPYPSVFELTGRQRLTVKRGVRNVGQLRLACRRK